MVKFWYVDWPKEFVANCREAIERYHADPSPDPFIEWYTGLFARWEGEGLQLRVLLILVDARFSQFTQARMALWNTKAVCRAGVLSGENVEIKDIPDLKGNRKADPERWRRRFWEALPKLRRLAGEIEEQKEWTACELYEVLENADVPDLGVKTSRLAVRWIHELVPGDIQVDMSSAQVPVDRHVYRVAERLGVVDRSAQPYTGRGSSGDRAIQCFARRLFSADPTRVDEPLWMTGRKYCRPGAPDCGGGCIFGGFCPSRRPEGGPEPASHSEAPIKSPEGKERALVIVSCVQRKIWGADPFAPQRVPAGKAYVGALFEKSRACAEKLGAAWCVFSAKYGFMLPDEEIENYEATFKLRASDCVQVGRLKSQISEKGLDRFGRVIILGGKEYVERARRVFGDYGISVEDRLEGLRIGERLHWLDECVQVRD